MTPYVLAITGASAQPLAEAVLRKFLLAEQSVHLVLSKGAYEVWQAEMEIQVPIDPSKQEDFWRKRLETNKGKLICHKWNDNSAPIASGSYQTSGMIIAPCTMGTVGRINAGVSLNLIERSADVHLKEKRRLVIVPREMPWNLIHLRNLTSLSEAGAIVAPPIPGWYTSPSSLDQMVDFIVGRIIDCIDPNLTKIKRWTGPKK